MRGHIDWRRTGIAFLAVSFANVLLIAFMPIMALLFSGAQALGTPWLKTFNVASFFIYLAYFALLFFGLPQFLLLMRLQVHSRSAYAITGVFSGWLFVYAFVASPVINEAAGVDAATTNPLVAFAMAIADPAAFASAFYHAVGPWLVVLAGGAGCAMSLLWPLQAVGRDQIAPGPGWYVRVFLGKQ